MHEDARIYVAGHRGLAGSAIMRSLQNNGYGNLITRKHADLDLMDRAATEAFFKAERPEYVFLAAAKVGGIHANRSYPADFIFQNLMIQNHVLHLSHVYGVKRLLFLGSSCIYPKVTPQPMEEGRLLSGPLEPTNSAYAVAKIAGIEMCWSYNRQHGTRFLPVMPTNLYGPGDSFDLQHSHVLPALIRKFHLAKLALAGNWDQVVRDESVFGPIPEDIKKAMGLDPRSRHPMADGTPSVVLWGTGHPRREFLLADDLADGCVHLMNTPWDLVMSQLGEDEQPLYNIGCGADHSIADLAEIVARIVGYQGSVQWDQNMPDGTMRKLLDTGRMEKLGWKAGSTLRSGIESTYEWYRNQE